MLASRGIARVFVVSIAALLATGSNAWAGPYVQLGPALIGTGESGQGLLGTSLAVSDDGSTMIAGAPGDQSGQGAVFVFIRSGGSWSQQGPKLTGGGETGGGRFGESVALSADGNTAIVGGDGDAGQVGAAWVFTRSGSTWTQQGPKLTGVGESGAGRFGASVSLSDDASTAIIGGWNDGGNGAVWIFVRSGSTWSAAGPKLAATGGSGHTAFGISVALSGDGSTALVGGQQNGVAAGGGTAATGAVWVYVRSGSTWAEQGGLLTPSDASHASGETFGSAVALSTDGNTALIGGEHDNVDVGAAWVFQRSDTTWTQDGPKLVPPTHHTTVFGNAVSLSGDGSTAAVAGLRDGGDAGAVWVFTHTGARWVRRWKLVAADETSAGWLGSGGAISGDAGTVVAGAPRENAAGGAVWVFVVPGTATTVAPGTYLLRCSPPRACSLGPGPATPPRSWNLPVVLGSGTAALARGVCAPGGQNCTITTQKALALHASYTLATAASNRGAFSRTITIAAIVP